MSMYHLDRSVLEALVARWDERTAALTPERPSVPLHVLLGDAVDLAAFLEAHYEPSIVDQIPRPGLASVEPYSGLSSETARELFELQSAIAFVQAQIRLRDEASGEPPLENADRLMAEIRSALSFLLAGDESAEGVSVLRRLGEESRTTRAHDGVAMLLEGYAELGARHAESLASIGVEPSVLDSARAEAQLLRARSATRFTRRMGDKKGLLRLRNRLIAALQQRLRLARRAIRYVFREQPRLARHASSAYLRGRRAGRGRGVEPSLGAAAPEAQEEARASLG